MTEKYYTPQEVADTLKITRRTVYTYIKKNQIKAAKVGRKWLIAESALNELIERGVQA